VSDILCTDRQGCPQDVKSQDRDEALYLQDRNETETLNPQDRDETETFDFSKVPRQDRDVQPSRPRRDKTFQKTSRDRDYIPADRRLLYNSSSAISNEADAEKAQKCCPTKVTVALLIDVYLTYVDFIYSSAVMVVGVKPFKCDQCDYSTVERSHLKVHIRVHTGCPA